MKVSYFAAALIFIISGFLYSQSEIVYKTVEDETYYDFFLEDWDSLIKTGNKAMENNIDYFYLRKRMGIASYELKKYRKAVKHLRQALRLNSSDSEVQEYLYGSYLLSGREMDAKRLTSKFSSELKSTLGLHAKGAVSGIFFEGGSISGDNKQKNGSINLKGSDNIYGEQEIANGINYTTLGLKHFIGNNISIFHSFTGIVTNKTKKIQTTNSEIEDNFDLVQQEYYLNANVSLAAGFIVIPAFHYINVKYNTISAGYDNSAAKYNFGRETSSLNDYSYSFAVSKDFMLINLNVFGTYSSINGKDILQKGLIFTIYPLSNLNLYTTTTLVDQTMDSKDIFIGEQKIGVKIFSKLWIEGFGTYGDISNYSEKNAFIVYNNPDKIKTRRGVSLILPLSKSIKITLIYENIFKEGSYLTYVHDSSSNSSKPVTRSTNYLDRLINGGLEWRF